MLRIIFLPASPAVSTDLETAFSIHWSPIEKNEIEGTSLCNL
jgi:hypothetical protein